LRNDIPLTTKAAANFTRNELAEALRRNPYQVNLLIGGYDNNKGPSLYFMDYLASMHPMPFGVHGYGGYFTYSIMDRYYKKDMDLKEGLKVIQLCINEMKTRFVLNISKFRIKIADKNGVREINLDGTDVKPAKKEEQKKMTTVE